MVDKYVPESVEEAVAGVVIAKYVTDQAKAYVADVDKASREYLRSRLFPGNKLTALGDTGDVRRSRVSEKYEIVNERAFGQWLEKEGFTDVFTGLAEHYRSQVQLAAIKERLDNERNGEIPAGVEIRETGGTVSATINRGQKEKIAERFARLHALPGAVPVQALIEGVLDSDADEPTEN
ncbi:hypothetical protein ACRQFN_09275 [Actinotignum sp. GS-2025e]|uniref:hypothetical protein n=1 Tax=unclassified Actinotignum TaxID=2632702 RepID=UPI003F48902A